MQSKTPRFGANRAVRVQDFSDAAAGRSAVAPQLLEVASLTFLLSKAPTRIPDNTAASVA
jgi:hypothetical protein